MPPKTNTDSDLEIALRHCAQTAVRDAIAVAGGAPTLLRIVQNRLRAEIRDGRVHTWAAPDAGVDGEQTVDELINELRAIAPGAFNRSTPSAAASNSSRVESVPAAVWQKRVGLASASERRELLRRVGAGEIKVLP